MDLSARTSALESCFVFPEMHFNIVATSQSSHKLCCSRLLRLAEHSPESPVGKRAAPADMNSQGNSLRWGLCSPGDGQNHSPISHQTMPSSLVLLYYFSFVFLLTIDFACHDTSAQNEWRMHREYSTTRVCTFFVMMMQSENERQGQIMYLGAGCETLPATLINYWHKQPD